MTENLINEIDPPFQSAYTELRRLEGRVFSNAAVRNLPDVGRTHPHFKEWKIRRNSVEKLFHYLEKKNAQLNILEVGCGNGWLSSFIAGIPQSTVTGIDINDNELSQATEVFTHKKNLDFQKARLHDLLFRSEKFDIIIFAASIQYFPSLTKTIAISKMLLEKEGEIHILDTHFYQNAELNAARQRTYNYFDRAGFPSLKQHYFHHCFDDLPQPGAYKMYDPSGLFARFSRNKNPFPWIRIQN